VDQEHDVVGFGGEVEGAEVGDDVSLDGALEAEVEVLERLASGEACRFDPRLAAVVLARRDLAFETRGEELLVTPTLRSGPLTQAVDRGGQ
jgi:hypothetical protein